MYLILLCFVILELKPSVSQFPQHLDLQKVGETKFNNEIYNILKPATHIVSDYFADYILRRDPKFPTKRILIDDNGFRHYWSGFDKNTKSLRKTEIASIVVETVANTADKAENLTSTNKTHDRAESELATGKESDKNDTKIADKNKENTGNVLKGSKRPLKKAIVNKGVKNNLKRKMRRKRPSKPLRQKVTRNIATATYYCPFFGTISMSAFID